MAFSLCVCLHTTCLQYSLRPEELTDPPGPEFQVVMSRHVGAGNQSLVLEVQLLLMTASIPPVSITLSSSKQIQQTPGEHSSISIKSQVTSRYIINSGSEIQRSSRSSSSQNVRHIFSMTFKVVQSFWSQCHLRLWFWCLLVSLCDLILLLVSVVLYFVLCPDTATETSVLSLKEVDLSYEGGSQRKDLYMPGKCPIYH